VRGRLSPGFAVSWPDAGSRCQAPAISGCWTFCGQVGQFKWVVRFGFIQPERIPTKTDRFYFFLSLWLPLMSILKALFSSCFRWQKFPSPELAGLHAACTTACLRGESDSTGPSQRLTAHVPGETFGGREKGLRQTCYWRRSRGKGGILLALNY